MKKTVMLGMLAVLLVASAVMLSGLAASAAETAAPGAAKTTESVKLVPVDNAKCPIMGAVMGKTHDEKLTRMYKGQRIGFCCEKCLEKWDAMSDAERDAKLKDAMKEEKKEEKK